MSVVMIKDPFAFTPVPHVAIPSLSVMKLERYFLIPKTSNRRCMAAWKILRACAHQEIEFISLNSSPPGMIRFLHRALLKKSSCNA